MPAFRKRMLYSGAGLFVGFIIFFFIFIDLSLSGFLTITGMPVADICLMINRFKIGILLLGVGLLTLYSLMTWALFNRISRPLQKIFDHILSFTEGDLLPSIQFDSVKKGEVERMAAILNAMIDKIKKQMDHLKLSQMETVEILESLGEGVLAVDIYGKTTFVNESACKILGTSREGILAGSLNRSVAAKKDLALMCHEAIQDVLQTNEIIRFSWNDEKIYLEVIAAPRPGRRGVILVLQDKSSDFKVLEMGKDFIANASHELKTPITIIRGFAETLQEHLDLSPQVVQEISQKIVRTSHRLENLVKSLLTLAGVENFSEEKFQTTDLISVALHSLQFAMTTHLKSRIVLTTDLHKAPVLGDPQLLDMAVTNLLENAVKYSPSQAEIAVSIQRVGDRVRLTVQDSGIGIPEADLPHIFDRFYTVDKARSRKSGGSGLGLSIVKTIVEKHMGQVAAESHLGLGSSFMISLPLGE
jgi:two-component system phosphate regulon sensor histidine kinase PhoR